MVFVLQMLIMVQMEGVLYISYYRVRGNRINNSQVHHTFVKKVIHLGLVEPVYSRLLKTFKVLEWKHLADSAQLQLIASSFDYFDLEYILEALGQRNTQTNSRKSG